MVQAEETVILATPPTCSAPTAVSQAKRSRKVTRSTLPTDIDVQFPAFLRR